MEKFVQNDIKEQAIKKGAWLTGLNNTLPIWIVLAVSVVLAGYIVVNYCSSSCSP